MIVTSFRIVKHAKRCVSVAVGFVGAPVARRAAGGLAAVGMATMSGGSALASPGAIDLVLGASSGSQTLGSGGNTEDPTITVYNKTGQLVGSINVSGAVGNGAFYNDGDGPGLGGPTSYDGRYTSGSYVTSYGSQTSYMGGSSSNNGGPIYFVFGGTGTVQVANGGTVPAGMVITSGSAAIATTYTSGQTVASGDILPASTALPAGTILPANAILPTGTQLPTGLVLAPTTIPASTALPIGSSFDSGTTFPSGTVLPSDFVSGVNYTVDGSGNITLTAAVSLSAAWTPSSAVSFGVGALTLGGAVTLPASLTLAASATVPASTTLTLGSSALTLPAAMTLGSGALTGVLHDTTLSNYTVPAGGVTLTSAANVNLNHVTQVGLLPGWSAQFGVESLTGNFYFGAVTPYGSGPQGPGNQLPGGFTGGGPVGNSINIVPVTAGNSGASPNQGGAHPIPQTGNKTTAFTAAGLASGQLNPTFDGGTLLLAGSVPQVGNAFTVTGNGGAIDTGGQSTVFNGQITDDPSVSGTSGKMVIATGSHVVLAPTTNGNPTDPATNNTWTGGALVQAGADLTIKDGSALGTGALSLIGTPTTAATLIVNPNGSTTISNQVRVAGDPIFDIGTGTVTISGHVVDDAPGTPGDVVKQGVGTLVLSAANTYTGGTVVSAGTLAISGAGTLGDSSGATTVAGGILDFGGTTQVQNGGVTLTSGTIQNGVAQSSGVFALQSGAVSAVLAGTGSLDKTTNGTVTLSAANTYTGATSIASGGTLALNGAGAIASSSGVTANGTFDIASTTSGAAITTLAGSGVVTLGSKHLSITNGSTTFAGGIGGGGGVNVTGGAQTLSAANTYTGATSVSSGAILGLSGSGAIATSSAVTVDGTFDIASTTNGASIKTLAGSGAVSLGSEDLSITYGSTTFAGGIAGFGGVNVTGGAQTLSGSNAYTGATSITTGATLALTGAGAIASSSGVTANGNFDIASTTSGASIVSLAGASTGVANLGGQTLTVTNGATSDVFAGVVQGSGGGVVVSGGTLTLNGVNTYDGGTTVDAGATLKINAGAALGSGALALVGNAGQTATLSVTGATSIANAITVTGDPTFNIASGTTTTIATGITGSGNVVVTGGGLLALGGASTNTYTGGTQIANGSTLRVLGGATAGAASTGSGVQGTITSNTAGTGGNLIIGDWTNGNANTFVSANYPVSGLNAATVTQYSTLVGNAGGSLGALSVTNAGTIDLSSTMPLGSVAIGGVATYTLGGSYTQASTGQLDVNIASVMNPTTLTYGTKNTQLAVTGSASLGGTLSYTAANGQYYYGERFDILTYTTTLSGTFANVVGNQSHYNGVVDYSVPNNVYLVLLPVINTGAAPATTTTTPSGGTNLNQQTQGLIASGGSSGLALPSGNTSFYPGSPNPPPPTNSLSSPGGVMAALYQGTASTTNQIGANANNGIGLPLNVQSVYSSVQTIGASAIGQNNSAFGQNSANLISNNSSSSTEGSTISSVAQVATGGVNTLSTATSSSMTATVTQLLNQASGSSQVVTNNLLANNTGSTPSSISSGLQSALSNINVASLSSTGSGDVGLTQSLNDALLGVNTSNNVSSSGAAQVAGRSASLVAGVGQQSTILGNVVNVQSTDTSLSGGQNSTLAGVLGLGNNASSTASLGQAAVNGAVQNASLVLNSIGTSGSTAIGAGQAAPFVQTYQDIGSVSLRSDNTSTTGLALNSAGALPLNQLSATTNMGGASLSGAGGAQTQNINVGLNNLASGGTLSGNLSQRAAPLNLPTLNNSATASSANANGGVVSIADLTQSQTQFVNLVSSTNAASGLALAQSNLSAGSTPLAASNVQTVTAVLGSARATGAVQASSLGSNLAMLGAVGGGNLTQNISAASLTGSNSLSASGVASYIQNAVQTSTTQSNLVR